MPISPMIRISSSLFIKIIINTGKTAENGIKSGNDIVSRFGKSAYQTFKKSFFFFCHTDSSPLLLGKLVLYQIYGYQRGYPFFLHGNSIKPVCCIHGTTSMCYYNKLCVLRQLLKISCKTSYIGIIQCSLDLIQKTEW